MLIQLSRAALHGRHGPPIGPHQIWQMRVMAAQRENRPFETVRFGMLLALLGACFLFGGASRNDVASLLVLQPLAVICAGTFLMTPGPMRWAAIKVPMLLLGALAATMIIQLVPLPPSIWSNLPGHGSFTEIAGIVGIEQPWRPISLTPDRTLASLVGLVTPFAVLVGLASVPVENTWKVLPLLIGATALSALLALAQLAGGQSSPLYFFDVTNQGSAVGFLANRNHQAVLIAITWPMLAVWASVPTEPKQAAVKRWIAVSLAVFFLPMLIVTGSRAGLIVGTFGLVFSLLLWKRLLPKRSLGRWNRLLIPGILAIALCVIGATIALSRDVAVQRLTGISFSEESRLQYLPTLLDMARDFFPVGAGFGSFEALFRFYEPLELLRPLYLNHAHNDLVELVISGGLPVTLVLVSLLLWVGIRAITVLRASEGSRALAYGRLGLLIVISMLVSSLVDYPLRTPLMSAIFAVACGWLSAYDPGQQGHRRQASRM
ncbi:hypothetical protein GRI75_01305 [Altererythrobacter soli]|uniref:O-antigen ligase-related domain-containing protein n=1 Tax=Croceibacterium soli TaxID=1739690 RepID=A0A6I4UMR9_9SPHN|nr:O-antigen ligase family protein [Croceibacterium soli]MXP40280.1 hypothetical protein [Croceibacterium soli]